MAHQTTATSDAARRREAKQALGLARACRLLRAVNLMLTSAGSVRGQSRVFDGDLRMVREAAVLMNEWAKDEGTKT